jgi:hypothetical protein
MHTTAPELTDSAIPAVGAHTPQRMLMWLMLSVLAGLLAYFAFRGYLNPEFLFNFANHMYC